MNKVISKDNWKHITSGRRQKRNALSDSDPNKVEGEFEDLYRFLEERYRYSKERAKEQLHHRIRR